MTGFRPLTLSVTLGMNLHDVLGWLEIGEMEGVDTPSGIVLPWGRADLLRP